jgi:hypothetical protein
MEKDKLPAVVTAVGPNYTTVEFTWRGEERREHLSHHLGGPKVVERFVGCQGFVTYFIQPSFAGWFWVSKGA